MTANASGSVSVLLGDGHGDFGTAVSYRVGAGAASVALGAFNGDGKTDIVTANYDGHSVTVLLTRR